LRNDLIQLHCSPPAASEKAQRLSDADSTHVVSDARDIVEAVPVSTDAHSLKPLPDLLSIGRLPAYPGEYNLAVRPLGSHLCLQEHFVAAGVLTEQQDRWRFSVVQAARRSCYVKSNLAVVDDASAAVALNFLVAAAFLIVALRFLVFAAFLPADFSFRVRAVFFAAELRFVGMGIPFVT
jgi:hypothetical protein